MSMTEASRTYKTFYGSVSSNSCAYCWKHHKALTPKQLRRRGCLAKQCDALDRCEHPYWVTREKRKEQRIARKERLEAMYKEAISSGIHS